MARKMIGLGATLSVKVSTASTATYAAVGGLTSFSGPNGSGDDVDTTTMSTGTDYFKTFQRGQVDGGELTLSLAYSSTDTSSKNLAAIYKTGAMQTWKVTFPSTAVTAESFSGFVQSMGRELTKDSMITRSVTIKVSGSPGFKST